MLSYVSGLLALSKQLSGSALSLWELGAQEVDADVTSSAILCCIKTLAPSFKKIWRWFSGRYPATIYCRLPTGSVAGDYTLEVVFHDPRPSDTINYFVLELNGNTIKGNNINSPPGVYYWQSVVVSQPGTERIKLELCCDLRASEARLAISSLQFMPV